MGKLNFHGHLFSWFHTKQRNLCKFHACENNIIYSIQQQVIRWPLALCHVSYWILQWRQKVSHTLTCIQHSAKLLQYKHHICIYAHRLHDWLVWSVGKTFPCIRFSRVTPRQTFLCSTQLPVFPTNGITTTARAITSSAFKQQCKHLAQTYRLPISDRHQAYQTGSGTFINDEKSDAES